MATPHEQGLEADWTWIDGRFQAGLRVNISSEGRIREISRSDQDPCRTIVRLAGCALLPGFVSAHSHAFQRALRGKGEIFPAGAGSFWNWREEMYGLVSSLEAQSFHQHCLATFREMLSAGITCVGEFHYLHHDSEEGGWALDDALISAAQEAGIRLVLLQAFYRSGGVGKPLQGAQARFSTPSLHGFRQRLDHLEKHLDGSLRQLGLAAHSIRAVPLEDLAGLFRESRERGLVLHMHVEEQRAEIEACLEVYQRTPMALINEHLTERDRFTAVHCTHTASGDLERFLAKGGRVCLCPLTEANLGDGLSDAPCLGDLGRICIGTDSNARICMIEEMRWMEYAQRLARQRRGVWRDSSGRVANQLFRAATVAGAAALGLKTGSIQPGNWADLVVLDLNHPSLQGWSPETLLDTLVFGGDQRAIKGVCVGGNWTAAFPGSSNAIRERGRGSSSA